MLVLRSALVLSSSYEIIEIEQMINDIEMLCLKALLSRDRNRRPLDYKAKVLHNKMNNFDSSGFGLKISKAKIMHKTEVS